MPHRAVRVHRPLRHLRFDRTARPNRLLGAHDGRQLACMRQRHDAEASCHIQRQRTDANTPAGDGGGRHSRRLSPVPASFIPPRPCSGPDYEGHKALPTIYLGVAVLMLAISALVVSVLAGRQRDLQGKEAATCGGEAASRTVDHFLDRLPPELGRVLVYLPRNVLGIEFSLKGIVSSPIVPLRV